MGPHVVGPCDKSPATQMLTPCLPGVKPVNFPVMWTGWCTFDCSNVKTPKTVVVVTPESTWQMPLQARLLPPPPLLLVSPGMVKSLSLYRLSTGSDDRKDAMWFCCGCFVTIRFSEETFKNWKYNGTISSSGVHGNEKTPNPNSHHQKRPRRRGSRRWW